MRSAYICQSVNPRAVENAFRHGEGVVTLAAQRSNDGAQRVLESKGHNAIGVDLLIADQGKGIAADHRSLVFSRFWHGSGRGSTGLGLYVVKGTIDLHRGEVGCSSPGPGLGSTFWFTLPLAPGS